jgi:hypothetical protein
LVPAAGLPILIALLRQPANGDTPETSSTRESIVHFDSCVRDFSKAKT